MKRKKGIENDVYYNNIVLLSVSFAIKFNIIIRLSRKISVDTRKLSSMGKLAQISSKFYNLNFWLIKEKGGGG